MADTGRSLDYKYLKWAKRIKERDRFTCQICFNVGGSLESHHLNAWSSFPEQRYNVSNGTTMCVFHHQLFHDKYGKGENTKEQFDEFKTIFRLFVDIIRKNSEESIDQDI